MNLLVVLMAQTNDHEITEPDKEGGRWRLGEPVDVFDADEPRFQPRKENGSPKFINFYIDNYAGTLEDAKEEFLAPHNVDDDPDGRLVARRKFTFDEALIETGRGKAEEASARGAINASTKKARAAYNRRRGPERANLRALARAADQARFIEGEAADVPNYVRRRPSNEL